MIAPSGKAIQVLIPKEDGSYDMDKVALKNLAEHPDVIHNPVAVISIAGAMREGKSFFLSLLVMYLESNLDSHWLDKPDTPIPFNFKWKGGIHRQTRGVWIWSKPYLVQKKNGTKIALLLMDSQGCFDKSGARNDSNIFTFGTMLSSVQIYNLNKQIKENDLQPLAVFIDYAKESMKKMQSMQCFQVVNLVVNPLSGLRRCGGTMATRVGISRVLILRSLREFSLYY
ncbi:unnamed protein product [Clavelina lepadiformis]|uniref:GB1/RHD3-type G domain-containing protein n=1 Tax=Clavelina lepadiformis TaxID=159417 RepID=A0ABP0GKB1_CLALP